MPRTPKVYGGTHFPPHSREQARIIVQATSWAEARRFLNAAGLHVSVVEMREYFGITGNARELAEAAKAGVGVVLARELDNYHGEYRKVVP